MGRSHAKNNTSGSVFTYHERNRLEYGAKKQRIGADSMKRIDSCYLCLQRAQNAVSCQKGHLYCKECILSSLVSQKSIIKTHQASISAHAEIEAHQVLQAKADARARVLRDFERGLMFNIGGGRSTNGVAKEVSNVTEDKDRGSKRKFEFDEGAVERLAKEAEDAAMKTIEAEQAEARRAKLPAFWLPTLTPEAEIGPLKDVKLQTVCQVGEHPHPTSFKQLIPVIFTYASASKPSTPSSTPTSTAGTTSTPICPSCSRELTNAVRSVLLTSRSPASATATEDGEPASKKSKKEKAKDEVAVCGHVVCGHCADTIVKPGKQCVVCEAKIRPDKDMIDLLKEGTGYAAAGGAESTKHSIAFKV